MATETSFVTPSDLLPIAVGTIVVGFAYSLAVTIVLSRTIIVNFIPITKLMGILFAIVYSLWKALPFLVTRGRKMNPSRNETPTGFAQLTKSVRQLYSPEGSPEMEIIFFHGLQLGNFRDAYWKTWVARDDSKVVWPKDWLSKKFPTARILSISYNTSAKMSGGQTDFFELVENLAEDIMTDPRYNIGQRSPVFFIGHSFGGIAIKQLILHAVEMKRSSAGPNERSKRIDNFIHNIEGIVFYSTPHGGSMIANVARFIPQVSQLVGLLKTLDRHTGRLNETFKQLRSHLQIKTCTIVEELPTPICELPFSRRFCIKIVQEASARQDTDNYFVADSSNHFTVCKPISQTDASYYRVVHFIQNLIESRSRRKSIHTSGPSKKGLLDLENLTDLNNEEK